VQPERLQASTYILMYMVTSSLPLLFFILFMYLKNKHLIMYLPFWGAPSGRVVGIWWFMMILPFLVKTPVYSVHIWLPKAHVEAPVAGSMILAGVLLKLGSYGLLRLSSIYSSVAIDYASLILVLSLWGACLRALLCIRQTDVKSLVAYSSVRHIGLIIVGILSQTLWGWGAALLLMVAHGLTSSSLFALTNMVYESAHRRNLLVINGLMNYFPAITMFWFFLLCSNLGSPPFINFLSEMILITVGVYLRSVLILLLGFLVLFTTAYCLLLYISILYGVPRHYINPMFIPNTQYYHLRGLHLFVLVALFLKRDVITIWVLYELSISKI